MNDKVETFLETQRITYTITYSSRAFTVSRSVCWNALPPAPKSCCQKLKSSVHYWRRPPWCSHRNVTRFHA